MDSGWNWTWVCPTGLTPWQSQNQFLSKCFQEICLQLPMLFMFAIISAYYFGNQTVLVRRNRTQRILISIRILVALLIIFLQFYSMFQMIITRVQIWPIDICLLGFQIVTWSIHIGFLLVLRKHGALSHRGPLPILVVWIALALLSCIWLRTSIISVTGDKWETGATLVALHAVYFVSLLLKGSSTYVQRRALENDEHQSLLGTNYVRFHDDVQIEALGQAQDEAPWLSKLLFHWVNPLIEKGLSGNLKTVDDLFDLPESLSINNTAERLQNAITLTASLFRALHRAFGFEFYAIGLLRFSADMLSFAGPLLLNRLLSQNNTNDQSETNWISYGYAFGLFATTLISAFLSTHFNWRMSLISLKMRMGLTTAIYRKTLGAQYVKSNNPEVLNLMSTDTDRIVNSCISFHSFWSIPFQLFATLYLLYTQIGIAFVGGVIFGIVLIPITRWLANQIASISKNFLEAKDSRVSQTFEVFSGAKQIKTLAWEDVFIDRIQNIRQKEMKSLAKQKYLDALCVFFWAVTPTIIKLLTFSTAALLGQTLTAGTAFASVALLNMLIGPLNAFPWVLNGLVEAYVSLKRVQNYLDLPEIDFEKYYSPFPMQSNEEEPTKKPVIIGIKNATFYLNQINQDGNNDDDDDENDENQNFSLRQISGDIRKGDLVCIEGPTGSGKTLFLNAINGNLNRFSGHIYLQNIDEGMAYVAQHCWLQHGTLRENVLWGEIFDESRYRRVIWSCALQKDIEDLGGDNTDIGENGSSLSGGQKARVALARACYQDKQIYLIDDVLASLDAHVSKHIVKHCILDLLKDRTRIVVTENRTLYYYSNQILHVEKGMISTSDYSLGSFESGHLESTSSSSEDELNTPISFELNSDDSFIPDKSAFDEIKESGALSTKVLSMYWKAWGPTFGLIVISSLFLMQISRNMSDFWLAHWIRSIDDSNTTLNQLRTSSLIKNYTTCFLWKMFGFQDLEQCTADTTNSTKEDLHASQNSYYLAIYIGIAVFNSIISLVRAFSFAYAGIRAAKLIHDRLLNSVLFTEFSFFDVTPVGRILNRFSTDTNTIDDSLPFILNILLAQMAGLIGALCVTLYGMPWLTLLLVPMCPIYFDLQYRYRKSSRDIKRLSSNALSPIYIHFSETIQGIATIRSMRVGNRFQRDFLVKLEESTRAQLTAAAAQQWLGLRLQMLGAFLIGGSGFVAVITSADQSTPELTGLVISYTLSFVSLLGGVLSALTETEQELIAVERVLNYSKLKPEINADGAREPPFGWPCQGVIKFENVTLKYRPYMQPSLQKINFQTSSCERIGIVGRTGAGKSSLVAALIRIAPLHSGHIKIDTVDISTLPLPVLRSRISVVSQDAFLFSGTIRQNLDPRNLHLDSHVWDAIHRCLATPLVQSLGGLNANLEIKGQNISAGQKQLLCLARALLRKSKIVVIDEGTSNLDSDSENAIQLILRNAFESSTVLLIAHRLNGLQQADRVFVVNDGQIVEEGNPHELSHNTQSRFYALLEEQQSSFLKPKTL